MSIIRIDHVAKSFGPEPVLRDVSLHVERGAIVGIAGRNGAGKSTLLRTINLLERPDSGTVVVAGRDLTRSAQRDVRAARQNIGMVFRQHNLLHNLTVFDNVALPLHLHGMLNPPRLRRRVLECLERVGLASRADDHPARLSGGQQQRVAIARALASQPEVLLCDEPTAGLDADTTRALLDTLRAAHAELGVTIVIASHDLPALGALCNRVAVLDDGVVAETFAPADTTAPRITALGRELAFYGTEAAALFRPGVLHA